MRMLAWLARARYYHTCFLTILRGKESLCAMNTDCLAILRCRHLLRRFELLAIGRKRSEIRRGGRHQLTVT